MVSQIAAIASGKGGTEKTTASVNLAAVRRSMTFCRSLEVPIRGVIENMSSYSCPFCQGVSEPFPTDAVLKMARKEGIPVLGKIPLVPEISSSGDRVIPVALEESSPAGDIFRNIAQMLTKDLYGRGEEMEKGTGFSR